MFNQAYPYYELPQIDSLWDMVKRKSVECPEAVPFAWYEREKKHTVTYRKFTKDCCDAAQRIEALADRGSHIGIIGENSYEWLVAFMAIVFGGNVAVVFDRGMTGEELGEVAARMNIALMLTDSSCISKITATVRNCKVQSFGSCLCGKSLTDKNTEVFQPDNLDTVCAIFLTSGTTGKRKGVMLTHRSFAADINGSCKLFELKGDTLAVLPFHHAFGLMVAVWMVFHYGYTVYISRGLRHIQRELGLVKPQTMMLVPLFVETFYRQILMKTQNDKNAELLGPVGRAFFGGRLEYIICGGAVLDKKYIQNYRQFGVEILNGYGTTECAPVAAVNRNWYHKDGTVGLAIPDSKIIVSESGEVLIAGQHVMSGYYNDPGETEIALRDGWYHTGDMGVIDEEGFLTLTGRLKNLIILSSGENISPEELEEKLRLIKRVTEVIVSSEGQLLVAEVYAKDADDNDKRDIFSEIQKLNRTWPMYKRISKVNFRDKPFEKTTTQKIVRKE